ncbi:MAG: hypothetical protein GXO71_07710 [Caldiserica bacterium]|nr:hypothetical protein [Caldisericota bacterium]
MLLKFFRKKLRLILWITIIGTVPAFIFFYGYSRSQAPSPYILAKVNGTPIYVKDFYQEVNQLSEAYPFIKDPNKIKQLAYQRLVEKAILLREAKKYRLKVSKKDLLQFFQSLPYFKDKKGNFRPEYLNNLTDEQLQFLETTAKENILINKMKALVTSRIKVSDKEVEDRYKEENTRYTLLVLTEEPEQLPSDIKIGENELKAYMEKNKDKFRIGPFYKITWIKVEDKEFYPQITVDKEEIKDYYQKHLDEFKTSDTGYLPLDKAKPVIEKKVRAEKARISANNKAFDLSLDLIEAKDWEKVLKGKRKVHTTGWIKGQDIYSTLGISLLKLQSLPRGESSEPLRVKNGYIVLKIDAEKPRYLPAWDDVKEKVKKAWLEEQKIERAKQLLEKVRAELSEGKDISSLEKKYKFKKDEKGPMLLSGFIPGVGYIPQLKKDLRENGISQVYVIGNKAVLVQVLKKEEPALKDLTPEMRERIKKMLEAEKKELFFSKWLEEKKKEADINLLRKDLLS